MCLYKDHFHHDIFVKKLNLNGQLLDNYKHISFFILNKVMEKPTQQISFINIFSTLFCQV